MLHSAGMLQTKSVSVWNSIILLVLKQLKLGSHLAS